MGVSAYKYKMNKFKWMASSYSTTLFRRLA